MAAHSKTGVLLERYHAKHRKLKLTKKSYQKRKEKRAEGKE